MTPPSGIRQVGLLRFASCTLLLITLPIDLFARSAAEADWQPSEGQQCQGSYVQPAVDQTPQNEGSIYATADSALHVRDHSTSFVGDIEIRGEGQTLKADFATIDASAENYTADGNVTLRQPDLLIKGDRISGNLFEGTAAVDSASFLLHKNRVRGSAGRIATDNS